MKDICNKYAFKINKNINALYFLYGGNYVNFGLTFKEQANHIDRARNEMDILVYDNASYINNELKCPKCGERIKLELFENLNKFNDNQKDKLNELKTQIELFNNVNDVNKIKIKIQFIIYIINDMIQDIEKNKTNIQSLINSFNEKGNINRSQTFTINNKNFNNLRMDLNMMNNNNNGGEIFENINVYDDRYTSGPKMNICFINIRSNSTHNMVFNYDTKISRMLRKYLELIGKPNLLNHNDKIEFAYHGFNYKLYFNDQTTIKNKFGTVQCTKIHVTML